MTDGGGIGGRQPKAIQNALAVLETVALAGTGVTAKQIARGLSMPPATVYRLVNILVAEEFLVRLPELSGFALGRRVDAFVEAALVPTVVQAVNDRLDELRMTVRVGIHLCGCRSGAVRYLNVDPDFPPPVSEAELNTILSRTALGQLMSASADLRSAHRSDDIEAGSESLAIGIYDDDGLLHAALWMLGSHAAIGVVLERVETLTERAQELDPLLR